MSLQNLTRFPRLEFIGAPTPLEYLPRFSDYLGRDIFIKRDDVTPMAMGGNKLRKLEFLAADALREGADTLITADILRIMDMPQSHIIKSSKNLRTDIIQSAHINSLAACGNSAGDKLMRNKHITLLLYQR